MRKGGREWVAFMTDVHPGDPNLHTLRVLGSHPRRAQGSFNGARRTRHRTWFEMWCAISSRSFTRIPEGKWAHNEAHVSALARSRQWFGFYGLSVVIPSTDRRAHIDYREL